MLRETIQQIAVSNGRDNHPSEDDINQTLTIVENDKLHRQATGLEPRKEFPFPNDYCYDLECFPNFFSCSITHILTGRRWLFEISDIDGVIVNQGRELYEFLMSLSHCKCRMVGFNNEHYDYPLIHYFIECSGVATNEMLYCRSQAITNDHSGYTYNVWADQRYIPQVDLYKIHHFDNKAKRTSLKMLEFNMRSHNIQELPYHWSKPVTRNQADHLLTYNEHDVDETVKFYIHSLPLIEFREELSNRYSRDFTNHNDTKIGKDYFIMELEKAGVRIGKHTKTIRDKINVGDLIFPYIRFEHPEFNRILDFFKNSVIDKKDKNGMLELKGFIKDLHCVIDGFQFDFGIGGLHGATRCKIYESTDSRTIEMRDVTSYYPRMAIVNRFYPEHLGDKFCDIYDDIFDQRASFDKGTNENKMLKLALNGVYGDSNNVWSKCFYDPQFTVTTTVNGQLMLCMLCEQLMKVPNLEMVNVNTDGVGFIYDKIHTPHIDKVCEWWENVTGLNLETDVFTKFFQRDVNNYIGIE